MHARSFAPLQKSRRNHRLICEQKSYPVWFLCRRKSGPLLYEYGLNHSNQTVFKSSRLRGRNSSSCNYLEYFFIISDNHRSKHCSIGVVGQPQIITLTTDYKFQCSSFKITNIKRGWRHMYMGWTKTCYCVSPASTRHCIWSENRPYVAKF